MAGFFVWVYCVCNQLIATISSYCVAHLYSINSPEQGVHLIHTVQQTIWIYF